MKITLSKNLLLKNLQILSGVIQMNHPLPILENFLFEISIGQLKITASDLDSTMSCVMEIESRKTGAYALPSRMFIDILKTLPEQPLTFDFLENHTVEIISLTGNYVSAYSDANQYPKAVEVEKASTIILPSKVLSEAISKTIFATGNDDLRPIMTGVYFKFSKEALIFVATDAHRLVRYKREDVNCSQTVEFIMPKKPLNVLKGILSDTYDDVTIEYNISNAKYSFGNTELICRLIDGKYPNFEAVIPKENPNKMVVDKMQLLNAVNCVSVFSSRESHQIRLKISGAELNISAEDIDYSNKAEERMTCDYQGEDIYIGFNARFLADMLKNIHSKEVQIEMSQPNRAGILSPVDGLEEGEEVLMLIMPSLIK